MIATLFAPKDLTKGKEPSNFVYLITGTDSGFGLLSSIALAKQGTSKIVAYHHSSLSSLRPSVTMT